MRINRYLAGCGVASRRKVEELIVSGKIKINGIVVTNLATDVLETDKVEFNGKIISLEEEKVYIMLNKPKCYVTTLSDEKGRRTVLDLVKKFKERIFPVGRLDFNTEGLLLLTNDGDFANNIIHPRKHISKTYKVFTRVKPTNAGLNALKKGIEVNGEHLLPAIVKTPVKVEEGYTTLITIFEGKNHQVKNMFSAIGCKVYDLKRIAIGKLELDDLECGKYKKLEKNELDKIFM